MKDKYPTITHEQVGLYRDRGSKFIAYAFPIEKIEDFDARSAVIRKDHPKARHFCFAYILGLEDSNFRYSDDGEPGGSAGLPIFNQLKSFGLLNCAVIVVRYFGGKKLGVPGLINAYKLSTKEALEQATIVVKYIEKTFKIRFGFDQTGPIMRVINSSKVTILENSYDNSPYIVFSIRKSQADRIRFRLLAILLNRELDDINGDEEVKGYSFEEII